MEQGLGSERFDDEKARITRLLLDCGVDINAWGDGDTKTVHQLVIEVICEESLLARSDAGELVRSVEVARGVITYVAENGDTLQLVEEKQVFNHDGEVRVSDHLSDVSVSVRVRQGEDPRDALIRGMTEKLEITEGVKIEGDPRVSFRDEDSLSYPGLRSQYQIYTFVVKLDASGYIPEGYAEVQEDKDKNKTNYFVWKKIGS